MIWYGSPYLAHAGSNYFKNASQEKTSVNGYYREQNGKRIWVKAHDALRYIADQAKEKTGWNARKRLQAAQASANRWSERYQKMKKRSWASVQGGMGQEVSVKLNQALSELVAARREYYNTPMGKVEQWVQNAGRNVGNWVRNARATMSNTLGKARNWAVSTGKNIFNAVKSWVQKAIGKVRGAVSDAKLRAEGTAFTSDKRSSSASSNAAVVDNGRKKQTRRNYVTRENVDSRR